MLVLRTSARHAVRACYAHLLHHPQHMPQHCVVLAPLQTAVRLLRSCLQNLNNHNVYPLPPGACVSCRSGSAAHAVARCGSPPRACPLPSTPLVARRCAPPGVRGSASHLRRARRQSAPAAGRSAKAIAAAAAQRSARAPTHRVAPLGRMASGLLTVRSRCFAEPCAVCTAELHRRNTPARAP